MRPRGASSAIRSAGRSWRTSWQKTFCSRTRRAISWAYCAPKSRTRTRSRSEEGFMFLANLLRGWLGGVERVLGEQLVQHGLVIDVAVTPESLDINAAIVHE